MGGRNDGRKIRLTLTAAAVLLCGCAVQHLPNGGTRPASQIEQMLAWNTALAQANNVISDNVIGLQRSGLLDVPTARAILIKQGQIAQADLRITQILTLAAACASSQAGPNATPQVIDAATKSCLAGLGPGLKADIDAIMLALTALANANVVSPQFQTISTLVNNLFQTLFNLGVISMPFPPPVPPTPAATPGGKP